jgi:hypothetical protein
VSYCQSKQKLSIAVTSRFSPQAFPAFIANNMGLIGGRLNNSHPLYLQLSINDCTGGAEMKDKTDLPHTSSLYGG